MSKSKFTYPKCPYCKAVYQEKLFSMKYNLMELVTHGDVTEAKVKCDSCEKYFKVTAHITYYGSKIKE